MCSFIFGKMLRRLLVAFDFDHTIIDNNSDIVVRDLMPTEKIPEEVNKLYRSDGWTTYMQKIFELLHSNGVTPEEIQGAVKSIPATPHMDILMSILKKAGCEVIIISDANSEFIKDWLTCHSLDGTVNQVFTNPAFYDSEGCLRINMYHLQDWCQLSTKNLCKGYILEKYIEERKQGGVDFVKVAYVGDGKNDLCPLLKLSANDVAFPRLGYSLMDMLENMKLEKQNELSVKAQIHPWQTGDDILNVLSQHL